MILINLYPWREIRRQRLKKIFHFSQIFVIVLLSIAFISFYFWLEGKQHALDNDLILLAEQQNKLTSGSKDKAEFFFTDEDFIKQLDQDYQLEKATFAVLSQVIPKYICFNSFVKKGKSVLLEGKARSIVDLISYLFAYRKAKLFSDIQLKNTKVLANHLVQFTCEINLSHE